MAIRPLHFFGRPSTLREYPDCIRSSFFMSVAVMFTASSVPYIIPAKIAFFQMFHCCVLGGLATSCLSSRILPYSPRFESGREVSGPLVGVYIES